MRLTKKTYILILASIVILITSVFAWYSISQKTPPVKQEAGEVSLNTTVYFKKNNVTYEPTYKTTYGSFDKDRVYLVNISSFDSNSHIHNLRVDFTITSSVETYFRVRVIDTLTLTYVRADGKTVELTIPKTDNIAYGINQTNWFYDVTSDWYYYKNSVTATDGLIYFIEAGNLEFPLWPSDYEIQFGLMIEAVQANGGPLNNWGLENNPWNGGEW